MTEADTLTIEKNLPKNEGHPLANPSVLEKTTEQMLPRQEMVPLVDYLRDIAGKPRGSAGGKEDLNSHNEEFIVKDDQGIHVNSLSLIYRTY